MSENKHPIGGYAPKKKVTESEEIPEFTESINNMPEAIKNKVDAKLKAITETCTLLDADLITECEKWIDKLCKSGGDAWVLEVPVNMNRDPDMLFTELIRRFSKHFKITDVLRDRSPKPAGAVWVKGAPNELKQHFARVPSTIEDNVIYDAVIWPTQKADYWYAAGNGFNFTVHNDKIIEYLDESGTASNKDAIEFAEWLDSERNNKSDNWKDTNIWVKENAFKTMLKHWQQSKSNP